MKRLLSSFLIVSTISIFLVFCTNKDKSTDQSKKAMNSKTNQYENNFESTDYWKLVWSDEFDGNSIDKNNWNFQVVEAGHYNDEWQRYTNSNNNAYIEDGNLVIKAIHESDSHGMNQYTSARLHTADKQTFKYGKIAARVKLPFSQGIWPAFWMLGANINENGGDTPWPQCGEIDIFEL